MTIEEIMSRPVHTCRSDDTLNEAARLMWENDCGALPVVNDADVVVGMITDRDICMAAYTSGASLKSLQVGEAMAKFVLTCRPKDTLFDAEALMARAQVRRLPVVDAAGRPIGIVSMNDIARETAGKKAAGSALSTLAAICEPRARALVKAV